MISALLLLCLAQDVPFQEYDGLVREVLGKTVEFQEAQAVARELGVEVALYGGSARDLAFFVRSHDAAWLRQQKQFYLVEMLGTRGSDIDLISTGRAEEFQERLMREHPPMGEFYRWEVRPVSKLDGDVERLQGRNTVDKILLSEKPLPVPARVSRWHDEGLRDAHAGIIRYVRSNDYFKSPQYPHEHDEFFEVLRALRWATGYRGVKLADGTVAQMKAVIDHALQRAEAIKGEIGENLFTRRVRQNLKKMIAQSVDLRATDRLVRELGVDRLMQSIGFEDGYKVARFERSYDRGATDVAENLPIVRIPQTEFHHYTPEDRQLRILLGGFKPSETGQAGRGLYLASDPDSSRSRGPRLVKVRLDRDDARMVDITQGEGLKLWQAYSTEVGRAGDFDGFAERYRIDVIRYTDTWYVLKNAGPLLDVESGDLIGRYLRSLARDPLAEKTRRLHELRETIASFSMESEEGRREVVREARDLERLEERLRSWDDREWAGADPAEVDRFKEAARRWLEDYGALREKAIEVELRRLVSEGGTSKFWRTWDARQTVEWTATQIPRTSRRAELTQQLGRVVEEIVFALDREPAAERFPALQTLLRYGTTGELGREMGAVKAGLVRAGIELMEGAGYGQFMPEPMQQRTNVQWPALWLAESPDRVDLVRRLTRIAAEARDLPGVDAKLNRAALLLPYEFVLRRAVNEKEALFVRVKGGVQGHDASAKVYDTVAAQVKEMAGLPPAGDSVEFSRETAVFLRKFGELKQSLLWDAEARIRYQRTDTTYDSAVALLASEGKLEELYRRKTFVENGWLWSALSWMPYLNGKAMGLVRAVAAGSPTPWGRRGAEQAIAEFESVTRGWGADNRTRAVKGELAGMARFAVAFMAKETISAAETRNPRRVLEAGRELGRPMFWVGLGAFSAAAHVTDVGVRMLPRRIGTLTRAWLPLTAGMAAMQGVSGRFSPRDLAWSAGTFLAVGTAVDVAVRALVGPTGWVWNVAKLTATLYFAEKLENRLRRSRGVRERLEDVVR
ncbi:MAG: hypothetical protein HYY16_08655 [Planctomycetes bacterium]|nr:hypothetical protein [Planctomycetota bacterium]